MQRRLASGPTAVDLFCGVGGLSLGLRQAGFRLLGGVDSEEIVLGSYKTNFPGVPAIALNLHSQSGEQLWQALQLHGQMIDLLVGGPPCQGFSVGGLHAKADPRNEGVLAFAQLVTELRPRYFIMENVRGFLSPQHEARRARFCRILKKGGYEVRLPILTLNAYNYGVPQRRVRAFILGHQRGEKTLDYPTPIQDHLPTVRDAIWDLAAVDRHSRDLDSDDYDGPLGVASGFAARLRVDDSGKLVTCLTGCLRTHHSPEVLRRFAQRGLESKR